MREIKFRARRAELPRDWEYGYFAIKIIAGTECESTGLRDRNGKEIYEGDIIKITSDSRDWNKSAEGIQVVEFWNGQFVYNAHRHEDDDYINFGWWVRSNRGMNILRQIEVIGNIYENPELLKQPSINPKE